MFDGDLTWAAPDNLANIRGTYFKVDSSVRTREARDMQREFGTASDWSKLASDDPLIAANIACHVSVVERDDNPATIANVPRPGAGGRGPGAETSQGDPTAFATPAEDHQAIYFLAAIYAIYLSAVLGVMLLLAAAI
jgi:hypothetical protein